MDVGSVLQGPSQRYVLDRVLGQGGFGTTWAARRESDGLKVAVKFLHIKQLEDWKGLELFQRETGVLRSLDHPNIPDYVDDFALGDASAPEGLALVQELVEGESLAVAMRAGKVWEEGQLLAVFAQLLDVLDYLHGLNPPVIHRDVTPKNLLLRPDGRAFLVDFGSVQAALRAGSTVSSTSAGTFGYAPMEQFMGRAFPSSDLYGLAVTLLAVASGREPEEMPMDGVRIDVRKVARLDARLVLLLEQMTEPDPGKRLDSARIALERIRPLLARHDGQRAELAPALNVLAAARSAAPQRPAVTNDDLLPSERIREAGMRLAELAGEAWTLPRMPRRLRSAFRVLVARDAELLVWDSQLVDLRTLTCVARPGGQIHAISANGNTAVTAKGVRTQVDGHWEKTVALEGVTGLSDSAPVALSPDGRSVVVADGATLQVYDVQSRTVIQRLTLESSIVQVAFSPDGSVLAFSDDRNVRLLSGAGEEQRIAATRIAFSPDGRQLLEVKEDGIALGTLQLSPLQVQNARKLEGFKPGPSWRDPTFSPDGRWLALFNWSHDCLVVYDLGHRRIVHTLTSPTQPKEPLRSYRGLGFSADSTRIYCFAEARCNRFATDSSTSALCWSVADGRYLGAIVNDDQEDSAVLAVTPTGFYCFLAAPPDTAPKAAKASKPKPPDPWQNDAVVHAALAGEAIEPRLDAKARAQLADLEERWAFFADLIAAEKLDADANVGQLLEASAGLTQVLDALVRAARTEQASAGAFGSGAKTKLTQALLTSAAAAMRKKPREELEAIHLELIREAETREAAEAQVAIAALKSLSVKASEPVRQEAPERTPAELARQRLEDLGLRKPRAASAARRWMLIAGVVVVLLLAVALAVLV